MAKLNVAPAAEWRQPNQRTVSGGVPAQRVRQHPVAQYLMEQFDRDDPMLLRVLYVLEDMAKYDVEITTDLIDRVIRRHRYAEALVREGFFVYVPPKKLPYNPRAGAPKSRFADIAVTDEVVYYARIGNRVKIGTSTDLRARMRDINPEELMVAERGGLALERERHRQFRQLRTHGEWFRFEGELVKHVERLRAQLASD